MIIKRKDIVTNKIFDRKNLIRISINKKGETVIDREYTLGGRGIYIHPNSIQKGIKNNIVSNNIKRFGGSFEWIKIELIKEQK